MTDDFPELMDLEVWKSHTINEDFETAPTQDQLKKDKRSRELQGVDAALQAYNEAKPGEKLKKMEKMEGLKLAVAKWLAKEIKSSSGKTKEPYQGRDKRGTVQKLLFQIGMSPSEPEKEAPEPEKWAAPREQVRPKTPTVENKARSIVPEGIINSAQELQNSLANWNKGTNKTTQNSLEELVKAKTQCKKEPASLTLVAIANDHLVDNQGPWWRSEVKGGPCVLMGDVGLSKPPFFNSKENLVWRYRSMPDGEGSVQVGRFDNRTNTSGAIVRPPADGVDLVKCLRAHFSSYELKLLDPEAEKAFIEMLKEEAKERVNKEAKERAEKIAGEKPEDEKPDEIRRRDAEEAKNAADLFKQIATGDLFKSPTVQEAFKEFLKVLLKALPVGDTVGEIKELVEKIINLVKQSCEKAVIEDRMLSSPGLIDFTARTGLHKLATQSQTTAVKDTAKQVIHLLISFIPVAGWVITLVEAVVKLVKAIYSFYKQTSLTVHEALELANACAAANNRLKALCTTAEGENWGPWDSFLTGKETTDYKGFNTLVALSLPLQPCFPAAMTMGLIRPIPLPVGSNLKWPSSSKALTFYGTENVAPENTDQALMFSSISGSVPAMTVDNRKQYTWPLVDFIVPKNWQAAIIAQKQAPELQELWKDLTMASPSNKSRELPSSEQRGLALRHYLKYPPFWLMWTHDAVSMTKLQEWIHKQWKEDKAFEDRHYRGTKQVLDDYYELLSMCHLELAKMNAVLIKASPVTHPLIAPAQRK